MIERVKLEVGNPINIWREHEFPKTMDASSLAMVARVLSPTILY